MIPWLVATFTEFPILTLFVVIGLGYLLGELSLFGFRVGVAGVLFAGLAVGALGPTVALPDVVPVLGQIIFVYTVGIHSGHAFFDSFGKQGARNSLLTVGVLLFGALMAVGVGYFLHLPGPRAAGLYCGALTSTPALAAARERVREGAAASQVPPGQVEHLAEQPVVAYSVAYPIGVMGVLLAFQLTRRLWHVKIEPHEEGGEILVRDFAVKNPGIIGHTVGEVLRVHKDLGFVISRIQHNGRTDIPRSDTPLEAGDLVAVVGEEQALALAQQIFGEATGVHFELDRSEFDYRRVYVSSKEVVGKRIRDLHLPDHLNAIITRLRRGDVDVVPAPDTRLETGDRIRVLTRKINFPAVSHFFGDSIRGTAETAFGSVAIGMVLGVMLGMLPIPLPGGTIVRLGLAGGPLLAALVLGRMERSGRITWVIPISANLTLRQIGLLLFLAGVGTRAGYSFAGAMREDGIPMLAGGALITFSVASLTLFLGHRVLRIPFDSLMGLMSGIQTQASCVAYASSLAGPSERPHQAYAAVYPAAMITKIVVAQLLITGLG